MFYRTTYSSPVGKIIIVSDEESIISMETEKARYRDKIEPKEVVKKDDLPILEKAKDWLDSYFKGEKPEIKELSLNPIGGAFRRLVWDILCEIPYGEVVTYGEIAKKVAKLQHKERMSAQAVGGAVGHNPIFIVIPCHRVIGADGSLTGYGGGIEVKQKLLELENVDMTHLYVPKKGTAL